MSYATGVGVLLGMLLAWVAVQQAWRRAFPGGDADPDALAGRGGCRGCDRSEVCEERGPGPTGSDREGIR